VRLEFTYQYKNLLFLFYGLFILLYFYARQKSKKRLMRFGNFSTLEKVTESSLFDPSKLLLILHMMAITALILGISSPVVIRTVDVSDTNHVIAFDTSASMFTDDIKPTRFDAAKSASKSFLRSVGNQSDVGLVSYSGKVQRITEGLVPAESLIYEVDELEMGDTAGTATGDALVTASGMFGDVNGSRNIILITDGARNTGVSLNESMDSVRTQNVSVDVIGIGETKGEGGGFDSVSGYNASRASFPNLNQNSLERIASESGGEAFFVYNRTGIEDAFESEVESEEVSNDISQYLNLFGVGILLLEWILKTTSFASIP